jgi:hypothetical protein
MAAVQTPERSTAVLTGYGAGPRIARSYKQKTAHAGLVFSVPNPYTI